MNYYSGRTKYKTIQGFVKHHMMYFFPNKILLIKKFDEHKHKKTTGKAS